MLSCSGTSSSYLLLDPRYPSDSECICSELSLERLITVVVKDFSLSEPTSLDSIAVTECSALLRDMLALQ